MEYYAEPPQYGTMPPPPRRSSRMIWWVLGGFVAVTMLGCGGLIALIGYVGAYGPETSVYTGNQVPTRFLRIAREVGALDEGEKILFFYSDALANIRNGFYFVSDRKVVVYTEGAGDSPLTVIPFEDIVDAQLYRNESFFEDSQISIRLANDELISFPVSSEYDRDEAFFQAIQQRAAGKGESP